MQKHDVRTQSDYEHSYYASAIVSKTSGIGGAPRTPLRRLDPLFFQLSQLDLVTSHIKEVYWINRRRALVSLLQELTLLQKLYDGSPLEILPGDESLQTRAMELNAHLTNTNNFGKYSNAEKINLLYQLRRAVEIIISQHFGHYHSNS